MDEKTAVLSEQDSEKTELEEQKKNDLTLYVEEQDDKKQKKTKRNKKEKIRPIEGIDFTGFYALAELMNMSMQEALDKCCTFQLKNLMSKIGKVLLRYNTTSEEMGKILFNTSALGVKETLVSPVYVNMCRSEINKNRELNQHIGAIIDFPFGESDFKSKIIGIKENIKSGVDSVTVMLPSMLLAKDRQRELKKQIKRIARFSGAEKGVAVSASDVTDEQIKILMKLVEKYNLAFTTLVFGNITEEELIVKVSAADKCKVKKQLKVLANVDSANGITELFKLKTDVILTPYADEIGRELVEKFKIKNLELK